MLNFRVNTFNHGIHPPENKDQTSGLPIRQFPFAPVIIIPLSQHIGAPSKLVVKEGQEVARGQVLAKADGYMSVPIHAPESGVVRKISRVPT
ncbi:MAG: electron transport complex subunit RsxC, partial [Bacteroidia bacterium]|nr:electron transport complex subunit RsxC [Bacteroidia bacterium]NNJ55781.1 electron transport complex subunit RsxC [Bacteroidia bacterium]